MLLLAIRNKKYNNEYIPFKGIKDIDFKTKNKKMYNYLLSNFNKSILLDYYLAILNVESNGDFYHNQIRYEVNYCNSLSQSIKNLLNNYGINCSNYGSAGISQILPDNFIIIMKNKINIDINKDFYEYVYKYGIIAGYYFLIDRYNRYKDIELTIRSYNGNPYSNVTSIYFHRVKYYYDKLIKIGVIKNDRG